MRNTTTAYNLARFAPQEHREPQVRVVRTPKKKKNAKRAFKIKCVIYLVALVALMTGTILSQLSLTEIKQQINKSEQAITRLESENAYLNYQMSNAASLNKLEQYAKNELGMVPVGPGQVEYVSLSQENKIVSETDNKNGLQDLWNSIAQFFFGE